MRPAELWELGDYAKVGDRWAAAGEELVDRVVRPSDRVLDVACGTGAVAIAAAAAGAEVIAVAAWMPDSPFGRLRPTMVRHLPPGVPSGPTIEVWGDTERVREFFAGLPVTVRTSESTVDVRWPSLDAAVEEITTLVPGSVGARAAIEPTGAWPTVCDEVRAILADAGRAEGDRFVLPVGFLTTLAQR